MKLPDWENASCINIEPETFFVTGAEEIQSNKQQIRQVCMACPVFEKCLQYSLHYNVQGIWAGTDEDDRKQARKLLKIVGQPMVNEYSIRNVGLSDNAKAKRRSRALKSANTQKQNRNAEQ